MALLLEYFCENRTWMEWSDRVKFFGKWGLRDKFYPHNMDIYNDMLNKVVKQRRHSTQYVKDLNIQIYSGHDFTEQQKNDWINITEKMDKVNMLEYILNRNIEKYIEIIATIEFERAEKMLQSYKLNQQTLENELQLNINKKMITVEVSEKKEKNKLKVKFLDQPARRSERIAKKY